MKLYETVPKQAENRNANGFVTASSLTEIPLKDIYIMTDEDAVKVYDFIGKIVSDKCKENLCMKYDAQRNYMFVYEKKRVSDTFEPEHEHICGVRITFNVADGKICGADYFSAKTSDMNRGYLDGFLSASTLLSFSLEDKRNFPEMERLFSKCVEEFDLKNKDCFAFNKNNYLLLERPFANKDFLWEAYNKMKPVCEYCRYNKSTISFKIKDINRQMIDDTASVHNTFILYKGAIYTDPEKFAKDIQKGILSEKNLAVKNSLLYGNDESFEYYLQNGSFKEPVMFMEKDTDELELG